MIWIRIVSKDGAPASSLALGVPLAARFGDSVGDVGRGVGCTLVLPDPNREISRKQALVTCQAGRHFIRPIGTNLDIAINGRQLPPDVESPLDVGAEIRIGPYLMRVERSLADATVPAPAARNAAVPAPRSPAPPPPLAPAPPLAPPPRAQPVPARAPVVSPTPAHAAPVRNVQQDPLAIFNSPNRPAKGGVFDDLLKGSIVQQHPLGAPQQPSVRPLPKPADLERPPASPPQIPGSPPAKAARADRSAATPPPVDSGERRRDGVADHRAVPSPGAIPDRAGVPDRARVADRGAARELGGVPDRAAREPGGAADRAARDLGGTPDYRAAPQRGAVDDPGGVPGRSSVPGRGPVPERDAKPAQGGALERGGRERGAAPEGSAAAGHGLAHDRGAAANDDAVDALFGGLGMAAPPAGERSPEKIRLIGELLRESLAGTISLLAARQIAKKNLGVSATTLQTRGNNPLKFSPNVDAALTYLLGPPLRGFIGPRDAVHDALADLRAHQVAMLAGMRAALEAVLERFDPVALEARLAPKGMMDQLMPLNRRARLWETFGEQYAEILREVEDDWDALFGKAFLQAYERQLAELARAPTVDGDSIV